MDPRRKKALERLSAGDRIGKVAADLGVHRSTIARWVKNDPEFAATLNPSEDELADRARGGLSTLVPQALELIELALRGDGAVSAARARVALDVIKTAASFDRSEAIGTGTLAERLHELDAGDDRESD